jgi:hypothetical protein
LKLEKYKGPITRSKSKQLEKKLEKVQLLKKKKIKSWLIEKKEIKTLLKNHEERRQRIP